MDYDSAESQIEAALKILLLLCSGQDSCVTVTKSVDQVVAPNGVIFHLYFDGTNPDVNGLTMDAINSDCSPFSLADRERIEIETILQGQTSVPFTSNELPLANSDDPLLVEKWLGADTNNLQLYIATGNFWAIRFIDYLGDTDVMTADVRTLPTSSQVTIFDDTVQGNNRNSVIISGISTGVPYFTRVSATSAIETSNMSKPRVASETCR